MRMIVTVTMSVKSSVPTRFSCDTVENERQGWWLESRGSFSRTRRKPATATVVYYLFAVYT